jgi:Fe-S cluster biogenesis protein NfuA
MKTQIDIGLLQEIESALDTIRPYLQADGGNVKVLDLTQEGILEVEMQGSCGECPMSNMTLKAGIEQAILKAIPAIKAVKAV